MPKYDVTWKRIVSVRVEGADKEEAAEKARMFLELWDGKHVELAEELVWCEELPDAFEPAPHANYRATVRIRRGDGWIVKEGSEAIDGHTHIFQTGWEITEEDSSIYAGEYAMIPDVENWPLSKGTPVWVATGDLVNIEELPDE